MKMKNKAGLSCLLLLATYLLGGQSIQVGAGAGSQAILDLNTSSLVWKGTGVDGEAAFRTILTSGTRYQVDLAIAHTAFKPSGSNYFSLSSSTVFNILTRFLEPIPAGQYFSFLAGWGFSSPILAVRHSNLWSMTTVIEGSVDLTACAGFEYVNGPWEASCTADLPVVSIALVQDYSASGNHVLRFASFHNSFQLVGRADCLYHTGNKTWLGLEATYARRSMNVIKPVDTWVYGLNLICRIAL